MFPDQSQGVSTHHITLVRQDAPNTHWGWQSSVFPVQTRGLPSPASTKTSTWPTSARSRCLSASRGRWLHRGVPTHRIGPVRRGALQLSMCKPEVCPPLGVCPPRPRRRHRPGRLPRAPGVCRRAAVGGYTGAFQRTASDRCGGAPYNSACANQRFALPGGGRTNAPHHCVRNQTGRYPETGF